MKQILILFLILINHFTYAEPLTIEINKENTSDVLLLGSNSEKIKNGFYNYIKDYDLIPIRYNNDCLNIKLSENEHCLFIDSEKLLITYKTSSINETVEIEDLNFSFFSDFLYKQLFSIDKSPFLDEFIFLTKNHDSNYFELLRSNLNGDNIHVLFRSNKSISSLSVSPNNKFIAYISFEKYYPSLIVQNLETLERKIFGFDQYHINSVSWKNGSELYISLSKENENYQIFSFNVRNKALTPIVRSPSIDLINPIKLNEDEILLTKIEDYYPQLVRFNIKNRNFTNLPISSEYNFSTDADFNNNSLISIIRSNNNYRIAHYNNIENSDHNILFGNYNLENPKFLTNNHFIVLTFVLNNINNIGIINKNGNLLKTFKMQDKDIVDLIVVKN